MFSRGEDQCRSSSFPALTRPAHLLPRLQPPPHKCWGLPHLQCPASLQTSLCSSNSLCSLSLVQPLNVSPEVPQVLQVGPQGAAGRKLVSGNSDPTLLAGLLAYRKQSGPGRPLTGGYLLASLLIICPLPSSRTVLGNTLFSLA